MKRAKKDRPEVAPSRRLRPRLAPRTVGKIIISNFREKASPNLDGGGGALPMSWEFTLTVIGAAGLVRQFARLIDWIES